MLVQNLLKAYSMEVVNLCIDHSHKNTMILKVTIKSGMQDLAICVEEIFFCKIV